MRFEVQILNDIIFLVNNPFLKGNKNGNCVCKVVLKYF